MRNRVRNSLLKNNQIYVYDMCSKINSNINTINSEILAFKFIAGILSKFCYRQINLIVYLAPEDSNKSINLIINMYIVHFLKIILYNILKNSNYKKIVSFSLFNFFLIFSKIVFYQYLF